MTEIIPTPTPYNLAKQFLNAQLVMRGFVELTVQTETGGEVSTMYCEAISWSIQYEPIAQEMIEAWGAIALFAGQNHGLAEDTLPALEHMLFSPEVALRLIDVELQKEVERGNKRR